MGTRSLIGKLNGDNSVTYVYCHWDGYPSHHGKILTGHYGTPDKIDTLLALGDMSNLDGHLGEKHDMTDCRNRPEGGCSFYHRDRGENWKAVRPKTVGSVAEYIKTDGWQEWLYLFADGKWHCRPAGGEQAFPFKITCAPNEMAFLPVEEFLTEEEE